MNMKNAGLKMSVLMGLSMSFCLSLVGMLSAGQFTLPGFLRSFVTSFLISFAINTFVPVRKIITGILKKTGLKPDTLKARLLDTLISDLMLSPLMTFVMIYLAYRQATSHGAKIPFWPMLLKGELISFVAAFILIFFLTPVYTKLVFKEKPKQQ